MKKYKTGLIFILIGVYLLIVSAFLTLAIDQALILISLYRASASPGPGANNLLILSFGNQVLILVAIATVLFFLVFKRMQRLLPVSIIVVLVSIGLNLYSGRHVLPQLLIWPAPVSLAEQYIQALVANDLKGALRLTDQSEACEAIMSQAFQRHQAQLKQKIDSDRLESSIRDIAGQSFRTFYDKPVPQGFVTMQPVPSQQVTIMAKMENGKTFWLRLKMRYTPFWGTRYICGQYIDD